MAVILVVMLALCVALGVVVYQRDTARRALTAELWQRHLRERSELQPRLQVPGKDAGWWDDVAATLPPDVLAAIVGPPAPVACSCPAAAEPVRVTILPGDTLESLRARYGIHVADLAWKAGLSEVIVYPAGRDGGSE